MKEGIIVGHDWTWEDWTEGTYGFSVDLHGDNGATLKVGPFPLTFGIADTCEAYLGQPMPTFPKGTPE